MTNNTTIAKNTVFLYVRMLVVLIVTLFTTRILLQSLGEINFGIYNVVGGVVLFISFLNSSLSACIQRYYNFEHGKYGDIGMNKVCITSCLIQLFLSIIILILAESVGLWYVNNILVVPIDRAHASMILFQCSVVSLILNMLSVPFSAAIMAYEKMDYYAYVGIFDVFVKLGIAYLTMLYTGDRLIFYGILLIIVSIIDFILYYGYVWTKHRILLSNLQSDRLLFIDILKFSSYSLFGSFAVVIRNQGLSLLLNAFFGPIINAARGISYQIKGGLVGFINNISIATKPQIVESYAQDNIDRAENLTFATSKICYYLLYMMALPVAYEMEFILKIWLGNEIPPYTVIFSILMLVIALIDVFNPPITTIIYSTGVIRKYNIITGCLGILVLPISYIALRLGGSPILVYIMSIFTSLLIQFASMKCLKDTTGISYNSYFKKVIIPCSLLTILTILIPYPIHFIFRSSIYRLIIVIFISIISVAACSYYCGLNEREKELLHLIIKKLFKK